MRSASNIKSEKLNQRIASALDSLRYLCSFQACAARRRPGLVAENKVVALPTVSIVDDDAWSDVHGPAPFSFALPSVSFRRRRSTRLFAQRLERCRVVLVVPAFGVVAMWFYLFQGCV